MEGLAFLIAYIPSAYVGYKIMRWWQRRKWRKMWEARMKEDPRQ